MQLLQWANHLINDGTRFQSFLVSPALGNAPTRVNRANRDGNFPSIESVSRLPKIFIIETLIRDPAADIARLDLRHYFETESGETKLLTAVNGVGVTVGVDCVCIGHIEQQNSSQVFQAVLETKEDPYWREFAQNSVVTNITSSGQQFVINIDSDQIIKPQFLFTPRQPKASDNAFKQFVAIRWNGRQGVEQQVDITDGLLDTQIGSTDFASATGDDIRLLLGGVFHDFWLENINTATTSIWTYLDFAETVPLTLFGTLPASGTIASIDFNEDISRLPNQGIILIDSEIFLYNGKNDTIRRIFIESRAAKNTVEDAHGTGADVFWIQHDLEIQFGDASLSAYPSNPAKEPLINRATSTNIVHDYLNFGDRLRTRPGNWVRSQSQSDRSSFIVTPYGDTEYPGFPVLEPFPNEPFSVMGGFINRVLQGSLSDVLWTYESPIDIANAAFLNGKKRKSLSITNIDDSWRGRGTLSYDQINGSGTIVWHQEALPLSNDSFQSWSFSGALPPAVNKLYFNTGITGIPISLNSMFYEVGQVTLTLDSTQTPKPFLAPQAGNYTLLGSLTHVELNKRVDLGYTYGIDQVLLFDTDTGEIIDQTDNSSQFQALINVVPPSSNLMPLVKGDNTLQWDELDIVEMDIETRYSKRYGA